MTALDRLNTEFAIDEQIRFSADKNGMISMAISNDNANASIALQGAHLLQWQPRGEDAVIWLSKDARFIKGKSVRGGIPICWPWFGAHDSEAGFPAHGYARTVDWQPVETQQLDNGDSLIRLQLKPSEHISHIWPQATDVVVSFTIGRQLTIELESHNNSDQSMQIGQALHTYFNVASIENIKIHGLQACEYLDKTRDFAKGQQTGELTINQETDRIYLNSVADVLLQDPGLKRSIRISKQGSASTVVWNPWRETAEKMGDLGEQGYQHMVCIESANAASDLVTIPAGAAHCLSVTYQLERLGSL